MYAAAPAKLACDANEMFLNDRNRQSRLTLHGKPPLLQWATLLALSLAVIVPLHALHFPAAVLLGAMIAAMAMGAGGGQVTIPPWPYVFAQGLVGCLIARSIGPAVLPELTAQWPLVLMCVGSVLVFSTSLGAVLAYLRVLPGTTAVWGSAPGAATAMVLMSESFGGDIRLVAFMQYLRVMVVAASASTVAHLWVATGGVEPPPVVWFPETDWTALAQTLALAGIAAFAGVRSRLPAGPLILTMAAGIVLSWFHLVTITLPPWLMAGCYVLVGWVIGRRFNREILAYAARAFPRILLSTLVLITLCGTLAWALHAAAGIDPLTAFLATSPGGADSIIAASSPVDVPFVMTIQTMRFLVVLCVGPAIVRTVARWVARRHGDV